MGLTRRSPPGDYHIRNYNGVILACQRALCKGKAGIPGIRWPEGPVRNTHDAMPAAHLLPPERSLRSTLGVLVLSLGMAILALVALDNRSDDRTTLIRPSSDASTEVSVLGDVIPRTSTPPRSPPASPATFPTTRDTHPAPGSGGSPGEIAPPSASPGPTLIPPVSVTAPDRPPRTTTTTEPTTTTTEEPTTTTTEPLP